MSKHDIISIDLKIIMNVCTVCCIFLQSALFNIYSLDSCMASVRDVHLCSCFNDQTTV